MSACQFEVSHYFSSVSTFLGDRAFQLFQVVVYLQMTKMAPAGGPALSNGSLYPKFIHGKKRKKNT